MDTKARHDFWDWIHGLSSERITILVSTHYMDEAEHCHKLAYIAAGRLLKEGDPFELGEVQFVLNIPENFSRKLLRGEHPAILLEADATDPVATGNAISAMTVLARKVFDRDLQGPLQHLKGEIAPFEVRVHKKYNPEGVTNYNIVPGLMGIVLTLTMALITGVAITRENERRTIESLLSTPVRPAKVITGKIIPYIIIGYVQVSLILLAAHFLFHVPFPWDA